VIRGKLVEYYLIFASAPVFGATPAAESGSVLMAMAGHNSAIEIVAPFGKGVIARDVMVVSDQPEQASLLKTLGYHLYI
jgi:3-hydroxyisobutyrate dehydrogenase-like beta-hydroxyacid dehydrogenase